jgi:multidrug efflux pump subunit AcrA (membrane-fusion protein)
MSRPWDDDELLARLAEAQEAAESVPRDFIEAGKAAYSWRTIDDELAELVYDSAMEEAQLAGQVRAEQAQLRALTFTTSALTIEVEVTADALLGQVVPPEAGEVEVTTPAGKSQLEPIDDIGCFTIRPVPAGSFRLHCRTAGGIFVTTNWLNL